MAVDSFANVAVGVRNFLDLMEVRSKNLFEIIMYKTSGLNATELAFAGVKASSLAKLHLSSFTLPVGAFEYDDYTNFKILKDYVPPSEMTMTFVEDELSTVINFINTTKEDIYYTNELGSKVFKDNQEKSKYSAVILPLSGLLIPATTVFLANGLKYKTHEEITFDQGDGDPLLITITWSVDEIEIYDFVRNQIIPSVLS